MFAAKAGWAPITANTTAETHSLNNFLKAPLSTMQSCNTAIGNRIVRTGAILLAMGLSAHDATAQPLVGIPSVIDGDTIEIHGTRIRLYGIDAPESAQMCLDGSGKTYRCGQRSSLALADFLGTHRPTSCIEVGRDQFRRMVAVCTAGGVDIAEWLVRRGYALDWPRYSDGYYASAQAKARAAKFGMWIGSFEQPWEWRKRMTVQ